LLLAGGGKLLWSITAAGAGGASDCTVNVYDECADPTESRFQRAPEYRELFSEIFGVLKRSVAKSTAVAEAKGGFTLFFYLRANFATTHLLRAPLFYFRKLLKILQK
jgi:hypothetical protein